MSDLTTNPTTQASKPGFIEIWRERWGDTGWRTLIQSSLILILLPWVMLALHAFGLSPWGAPLFRNFDLLLFATIFLIPVFLIAGAMLICFPGRQQKALLLIVAALVSGFGVYATTLGTHLIRHYVFTALAERSMPLVKAIKSYERDKGEPPGNLEALVPAYIPEIPGTGVGMYPQYHYGLGTTRSDYPWILGVSTSLGLLNFDRFIYVPAEVYPKQGWGGVLKLIGKWAYVHE